MLRVFTPAAGDQRYHRATLESHKLDRGLSSAATRWGLQGEGYPLARQACCTEDNEAC